LWPSGLPCLVNASALIDTVVQSIHDRDSGVVRVGLIGAIMNAAATPALGLPILSLPKPIEGRNYYETLNLLLGRGRNNDWTPYP